MMFLISVIVVAVAFSAYIPNKFVYAADQEKVVAVFQDNANVLFYPNEIHIYELSVKEFNDKVLPHAATVIADTIKSIKKETGETLTVEDVINAMPEQYANSFLENKGWIAEEVKENLK